jgi:non-specific serine/threonine protein kinase
VRLSSFIGRERELNDLRGRLTSSSRLVTIVGAGGIGKTRLALQVGAELTQRFQDGVRLVELAGLSDPRLVPENVLAALALSEPRNMTPEAALIEALRSSRLLIILDNCEHLIDACACLIYNVLVGCPELRVLATSRKPLGIEGEVIVRLHPLTAPLGDDVGSSRAGGGGSAYWRPS